VSQTSESYITDLSDIWKNRSGLWGLTNLGAWEGEAEMQLPIHLLEINIIPYCVANELFEDFKEMVRSSPSLFRSLSK
jgi:hypothetical protein